MRPTTATEIKLMRDAQMLKLRQQLRVMQEPYKAYQRMLNERLSSLIRAFPASSRSDSPADGG